MSAIRAIHSGSPVGVFGPERPSAPMEFEVPPETEATLRELEAKVGGSRAEVLSWAIALLKLGFDLEEKGQRLAVLDRDDRVAGEVSLQAAPGA